MNTCRIAFLCVIACALGLFTATAQAALIEKDYLNTGDGLITRDTDTHLEWLDLTETDNLSYNYVANQLGQGGRFNGWRYATAAESENLFTQLGFDIEKYSYDNDPRNPGTGNWTPELQASVELMVSYLGEVMGDYTTSITDMGFYFGVMGMIANDNGLDGSNHRVRGAYSMHYSVQGTVQTGNTSCCTESNDYSDLWFGHYLVREITSVPEPTTIALIAFGLAGLSYRRVKWAKNQSS